MMVYVWSSMCTVGFVLFFFFQAEDGIRDLTVTGVQTCALPILPALFRLTKKVATPLTAATGVVPLSALPPGLLPSAMATASLNPVATFPKASSARTFTAGLIWRFATVVLGCVPNTSWVAAPGVILKPLLVVGFRPVAVALSA